MRLGDCRSAVQFFGSCWKSVRSTTAELTRERTLPHGKGCGTPTSEGLQFRD